MRKTVKELLAGNHLRPITIECNNGETISGLVSEYRVDKSLDTEGKYLYDIRHADSDWGEPATIEDSVVVNWFGTLILDKPLEILESDHNAFLEITDYCYDDE